MAGAVEFSDGYDPSSQTRKLYSMLGPLIKQHVQRKAPKPKPRRSRWSKATEESLLEKQTEEHAPKEGEDLPEEGEDGDDI